MTRINVFSVLIRLDGGGAERSVSRMVDPLATKNVRLTRFAIDSALPGEESDPMRTLAKGSKWEIHRIATAAIRLSAIIRRERPDIIHLNCEAPEVVGLISRILTLSHPYGIVVTDHSMKSWSGARRIIGRTIRACLEAFGAVYVNCFLADQPLSRAPVVLNPTAKASPLPRGISSSPRLVVIGRVIESKRIDRVLRAASSCQWPHQIVVIGSGDAMSQLRNLVQELHLKVEFLGHQADPWADVRADDVFVTASAFEGEPLTLIEALQRGLPVLASDIPAHEKVLGNHSGIFGTPAELSKLLSECLNLSEARERFKLSAAEVERILALRDPDHIASQWRSIYESQMRTGAIREG